MKQLKQLLLVMAIALTGFTPAQAQTWTHYSEWMANTQKSYVYNNDYWRYDDGLMYESILDTYEHYKNGGSNIGDETLKNAVKTYIDKCIDSNGNLLEKYEDNTLDDIRPARMVYKYYKLYGGNNLLKACQTVMNCTAFSDSKRVISSAVGNPWQHKESYSHQVWLDGIFMGLPFWTLAGPDGVKSSHHSDWGANDYFYDAYQQMIITDEKTYETTIGLWCHAWDEYFESTTNTPQYWSMKNGKFTTGTFKDYHTTYENTRHEGRSSHCWGRAAGWFAMAIMETMDNISAVDANYTHLTDLQTLFKKVIDAVWDKRDINTGMWRCVLDVDDSTGDYKTIKEATGRENYLEATCSAMFTYCLLHGVAKGYLPASYLDKAKSSYQGLINTFITTDGGLKLNNCMEVGGLGGTTKVNGTSYDRDGSFAYYTIEKKKANDSKGVGPFIWASLEAEKIGYQMATNSFDPIDENTIVTFAWSKASDEITQGTSYTSPTFTAKTYGNDTPLTNSSEIVFESSDPLVATVAVDGTVTPVGIGTATITAALKTGSTYTWSGTTPSYTITVNAPDTTAPTLEDSTPTNGATNIATSGNIVLTFSEDVACTTNATLTTTGSSAISLTPSVSGSTVTYSYSGLSNSTSYTFNLAANSVADTSGNNYASAINFSFTTKAASAQECLFTVTSPSSNSDTQNNVTVSSGNNIASKTFNGTSGTAVYKIDSSNPINITSTTANINKISFTACNNSSGTSVAKTCKVSVSTDGSAYETLSSGVTVSGGTGTSSTSTAGIYISGYDGATTVTVEFEDYYRYIRIERDGKETWVNNLNVYGSTGSTPTTYTLTNTVNEAGYGTVSPATVYGIASGTTTSSSSNTYTVGETTVTATATAATAEYNYAFSGWSGLPATVSANATVTANFTRTAKEYTLEWNSNGGSALSGDYTSGTVDFGTAITAPNAPTRTGYTFTGWNSAQNGSGTAPGSTMPAANTTYYAQWLTTNNATFSNGSYTIGSSALDLSTLFTSNSNGAVTYTVTNAGSTGASITGTSFTATTAGTATVKATQAATATHTAKEVTATITVSAAPTVATPTITGTTPFSENTTVTISCGTDGATIHYTTDGSNPTSSSTTYTEPFSITATTTIKAIAVKSGMTDSEIASQTFTKDNTAPTVSMTTPATTTNVATSTSSVVLTVSEEVTAVGESIAGTFNGSAITFTLTDATHLSYTLPTLANSTTYTIALNANQIQDAAGNQNAAANFSFTTVAASSTSSYTVEGPTAYVNTENGITISGTTANLNFTSSGKKDCFTLNSASSVWVYSQLTNISAISFDIVRNTNGNTKSSAVTMTVSSGGAFSTPTSGFTATNDGSNITDLSAITAVGNNQSNPTAISVSFTTPVKEIVLTQTNNSSIRNIKVTYNNGTLPTTYYAAHISGTNTGTIDTNPGGASTTVATNNGETSIDSKTFYKLNSNGVTIDLGSGHTFATGDQIAVDIAGSGTNKANCGITIKTNSNTEVATLSTGSVTNAFAAKYFYVVQANDGIQGQQIAKFTSSNTNGRFYSYAVLRNNSSVTTYTITATSNNNEYGTVSTSPTTAAAGATVTITTTPASGYELTALTAKDASNNDVTITNNQFTMPASNVTVNATFAAEVAKVATPVITPADGTVFEGTTQSVSISCGTSGASIYYTLDGTTPTSSSTAYSSAFTIYGTKTVKAIAVKSEMTNSDVATATITNTCLNEYTAGGEGETYTISQATQSQGNTPGSYTSNSKTITVANNGSLTGGASGTYKKYGAATWTITLPENVTASSITFTGKVNADGSDNTKATTITNVDGEALSTAYSFNWSGGADVSRTYNFATPQNEITFVVSGYQLLLTITLTAPDTDGSLTLKQNATEYTPVAASGVTVTLQRTLQANKWNALCLPFDVTPAMFSSATNGATTKIETLQGVSNGVFTFAEVNEVSAGTPFIAKPTAAMVNPVFSDVEIKGVEAGTVNKNEYSFKGNYTKVTLDPETNLFISMSQQKLVPPTGSCILQGLRGYFIVPSGEGARVSLDFNGQVVATDINELNMEHLPLYSDDNTPLYNLSGQRVSKSYKGIVIVNGKKVLRK